LTFAVKEARGAADPIRRLHCFIQAGDALTVGGVPRHTAGLHVYARSRIVHVLTGLAGLKEDALACNHAVLTLALSTVVPVDGEAVGRKGETLPVDDILIQATGWFRHAPSHVVEVAVVLALAALARLIVGLAESALVDALPETETLRLAAPFQRRYNLQALAVSQNVAALAAEAVPVLAIELHAKIRHIHTVWPEP
jgi:hypothetical protein